MSIKQILVLLMIICCVAPTVYAGSCQYGRPGCMASCMVQSCGTGYCPGGTNGICVCSRCGNGPPW